jgi:HSP90 family molecular chaperone
MEQNLFQTDYLNILKVFRSLNTKPSDALRDIADNGYDAGATELRVHLEEKKLTAEQKRSTGKQLERIVIADNGRGMSHFELLKSLVPAETGRERNLTTDLGFRFTQSLNMDASTHTLIIERSKSTQLLLTLSVHVQMKKSLS